MKKAWVLIPFIAALGLLGCVDVKPSDNNDFSASVEFSVPPSERAIVPTHEPTPEPTPELTPTPEPTLTPEPTATPIPTASYKSRVPALCLVSAPSEDAERAAVIGLEGRIDRISEVGNGFSAVLYDGEIFYCRSDEIVPAEKTLYGYLPYMTAYKRGSKGEIVYASDGITPIMLSAELIDIRLVVPNVEIYQIFGEEGNFTGNILYIDPVPVLQKATAEKLAVAAKKFAEDGYRIKIYDCYRPKTVQFTLYDIVQNSSYIANPYKGASDHNRAAAVDMTLIGPDGKELEFPSEMHTFEKIVNRASRDKWTEEQRRNVDYMTDTMIAAGFSTIASEWWHFADTDAKSFIPLMIDMRDIPRNCADALGYAE